MAYVGRWSAEKRIHLLKSCRPAGTTLAIVGDGPMRRVVESWHDPPRVVVLTGMRPRAELARVYRATDWVASASAFETFGNVPYEAAHCGTPALLQDAQGFNDQVDAGESRGALLRFDAEDGEARVAAAMDRTSGLLKNPARVRAAARKHAMHGTTLHDVASDVVERWKRGAPRKRRFACLVAAVLWSLALAAILALMKVLMVGFMWVGVDFTTGMAHQRKAKRAWQVKRAPSGTLTLGRRRTGRNSETERTQNETRRRTSRVAERTNVATIAARGDSGTGRRCSRRSWGGAALDGARVTRVAGEGAQSLRGRRGIGGGGARDALGRGGGVVGYGTEKGGASLAREGTPPRALVDFFRRRRFPTRFAIRIRREGRDLSTRHPKTARERRFVSAFQMKDRETASGVALSRASSAWRALPRSFVVLPMSLGASTTSCFPRRRLDDAPACATDGSTRCRRIQDEPPVNPAPPDAMFRSEDVNALRVSRRRVVGSHEIHSRRVRGGHDDPVLRHPRRPR